MVDAQLLEILVCPETKEPVRLADDSLLERLNKGIEARTVMTRAGEVVQESIHEGLVREDGRVLYVVREDIPIMLIDEQVLLDTLGDVDSE